MYSSQDLQKNVLIIGCGKVGSAISKKIVKKEYLNQLLLYDRDSLKAELLTSSLKNSKVKTLYSISEAKNCSHIILTLSALSNEARKTSFMSRSSTHEIRHDELEVNLKAFELILPDLKKLIGNVTIIVVSNPVEELVSFLHKELKYKKIYGFGLSLDVFRYKKLLNRKIICIGEHGKAIPLLNLKSKSEYLKLSSKIDQGIMDFLRNRGMTYKITASEFSKLFDKLNNKKESTIFIATYLDKPFLGESNIVISLPFRVRNGELLNVLNIKPSNIEIELFKEQVKERKSTDHINL